MCLLSAVLGGSIIRGSDINPHPSLPPNLVPNQLCKVEDVKEEQSNCLSMEISMV